MEYISCRQLSDFFKGAADIFTEKKQELCEMDAKMGDGDLGLTMCKGFGELPLLIAENQEPDDIGKTLRKAGMKMASLVPSTMGTLMASGLMEGGKAVAEKAAMGPQELSDFLTGFASGIQKRGKCQPGDRTILDAMQPAAEKAMQACAGGGTLADIIKAAVQGASEGVEATKQMVPKFGKAAVFAAKAQGVPDQGAVAGQYLLEGLARYLA